LNVNHGNSSLRIVLVGILGVIAPVLCGAASPKTIPSPARVVVVMEENHGYGEIIGSPQAPYINELALAGASFTNAHAITHPSLPNYLALFSGSTQGVTDDSCPLSFRLPNLQRDLLEARLTFVGYSEDLPATGSDVCYSGDYARKHAPWAYFPDDPPANNRPFADFPSNLAELPTVSWVIPNQVNDMHSGPILQADNWLRRNLSRYVTWAQSHNSILIIDWDEDDGGLTNHIPTIFVGPMVKPGRYSERIDHYNVLRTIEDMYGLSHLGDRSVAPIVDVWQ
jgi:phosphatidylinositol-3-phosphatase